MEEYDERKKKWFLDIKNTPCARSSLLNGIMGGTGLGLVYYYFRGGLVRRSCDVAVGGFVITALVSWEVCRYKKAKERAQIKRAVSILNRHKQQQQEDDIGIVRT